MIEHAQQRVNINIDFNVIYKLKLIKPYLDQKHGNY